MRLRLVLSLSLLLVFAHSGAAYQFIEFLDPDDQIVKIKWLDDMARAVIKDGAYYFSLDIFNAEGFKVRADFTLRMACPFKGYVHENGAGELVVSGKVVK